jgi:Carboxypeptidase regulatory-like domain
MTHRSPRLHPFVNVVLIAVSAFAATANAAPGQNRAQTGSLRVVVKDPSGAVIPAALVQVKGEETATSAVVITDVPSDAQGVALARELPPGRYAVSASFPGFDTVVITGVRIRPGDNRREITLPIQRLDESVSVARDPATSASDPNSDRFGNVLSKDQINALPDDPDEMEQTLKNMAGPDAVIRVDGFRGGKLPPKSQIRSIRFASGMFAAENHSGGHTFVDIITQPGLGPLRGSMDFTFRDDSLNARNAFQPSKGPEQTQQYNFSLNGTLIKNRTSFSLVAGGASLYDSANVYAALPNGTRAAPIRRPTDRINFNGRLDHALTKSHTLRASFQQNYDDLRNLGVGNFDLPGRAYSRTTSDSLLRLSESGPLGRKWFGESRLQLRWRSIDATSLTEAPTVKVLDAFSSGGAQQAGGSDATELEWATNVDWVRGKHAVRLGSLVEGGWYKSDSRTNYLGTFTFTSNADFEAGRPASYSRRIGDPLVDYSHFQAGVFVQDDWRLRKNLTVSFGVRQELQTHLGDALNVAPRAGFTWAPFKSGKTSIRGGGGIFYDWLEAATYEQVLRVDGVRQQDLIIQNPGFPDPFAGGASQTVLPTSKYILAPDLVMPKRAIVLFGLTQQLTPNFMANINYSYTSGYDWLRGRNINAPLANGQRPDPAFGNITQVESTARMRGDTVNVGVNWNVPARRTFLFANYAWLHQQNDADGPFSLPANSYDLAAEWGPAVSVPRHIASAVLNTTVYKNIRLGLTANARSGTRYNITTGSDDNGDTVFNDRPVGVGRNAGSSKGMWDVGARVSYAFGFGDRSAGDAGPVGGGTMIVQRVGPGGPDGGGLLSAIGGGGAENKRVRFELYAAAQNVLNHVNPINYSGVMSSEFFGQPTAALPGRRIDVGMRIGF